MNALHYLVCAHGDLFHESVPDEWIDRVFAVMALAPQHTFQVLTKRAGRMRQWVKRAVGLAQAAQCGGTVIADELPYVTGAIAHPAGQRDWPLANVWLGVSVEDQARANERIPDLCATPAAKRFLSMEPLLGPVNLRSIGLPDDPDASCSDLRLDALTGFHSGICRPERRHGVYSLPRQLAGLDWIIVGGESGPGARPMNPDWARSLRDQCQAAFVPFFFKQWGEWAPGAANSGEPGDGLLAKVGKKAAGRLLDGREWSEFPA